MGRFSRQEDLVRSFARELEKTMKLIWTTQRTQKRLSSPNIEAQDFFRRRSRELHVGSLEDPDTWQKLGMLLANEAPENYSSHENASEHTHA
jgi:hypothetical protein